MLPLAEQPARALELQPFDRRARPRRRGGLGADAVSVREAEAVRSARHVRDRVLSSRTRRSGRASPSRFPSIVFGSAGIGDPTLPRRWESGGAGLVSTDRRLRPLPANAAERRRAGRQALPQARDGRVDDVGPDRAGDRDHSRPLLFSGPDQRLRSWLCRAHLAAAEYDMAARRIPLGRRRRQLLFRRSRGRPACRLHGAGARRRAGGFS